MKRDRDTALRLKLLPVLHFIDEPSRDCVIRALGATSIGETCFGELIGTMVPGDPLVRQKLYNYVISGRDDEERLFACVIAMDNMEMCESAQLYNAAFKFHGLLGEELKSVLSIDRSNHHARIGVRGSFRGATCDFPTNVESVLNYLDLNPHDIPSVQNLKDACFRRIVVSQNPMRFFEPGAFEQLQEFALMLFDPNNLADLPVAVPPPPPPPPNTNASSSLALDSGWAEKLLPIERLEVANEQNVTCIACCHYKKTILLVPCGHVSYCDECFRKMMTSNTLKKQCPECKQNFTDLHRAYW
jgi:hypothetical protein